MSEPAPPTDRMPSPYPAPGTVVDGKYQVERILGEGGMGAVAKATHLLRRAPVALKFMSPMMTLAPGAIERFLNEGVAASQIDSDHVVKIFDVGQPTTPGAVPYLVMEYLEGVDLSELLVRDGRPGLDPPRAVHFVLQTLRGLQVAHAAGIIHRDIKPSNVFIVTKDGEPDFVKLVDFGISKVTQQQPGGGALTKTNSALGTPLYMSPEQARRPRDVDLRTDLYSVAVILYELLSAKTPFFAESGEYTELLFKIFTTEPPPIKTHVPSLPDGLAAALHKGMAREPNDRFASAAEMAEALAPWADGRSAHALGRLLSAGRAATRSHAPPSFVAPAHSVVPASPEARAQSATAKTQGGLPSIPAPARVPVEMLAMSGGAPGRTDMGASRDAVRLVAEPVPPGDGRRTVLAIGFVVVALLGSLAGGAILTRGRGRAVSAEPDAGGQTATAATENGLPPAQTPQRPENTAPDTTSTPRADTSARPTATAVAPLVHPPPPASGTPTAKPPGPTPGRPGQLTDIRPAQ